MLDRTSPHAFRALLHGNRRPVVPPSWGHGRSHQARGGIIM